MRESPRKSIHLTENSSQMSKYEFPESSSVKIPKSFFADERLKIKDLTEKKKRKRMDDFNLRLSL